LFAPSSTGGQESSLTTTDNKPSAAFGQTSSLGSGTSSTPVFGQTSSLSSPSISKTPSSVEQTILSSTAATPASRQLAATGAFGSGTSAPVFGSGSKTASFGGFAALANDDAVRYYTV
jgi:hypothetical protein